MVQAFFQGTFTNRIDAKGRISVPAPLRRVLEENDPEWVEGANANLSIIYKWPNRSCLEAFSVNAMNALLERILHLPSRSKKRQLYSRLISSNSQRFQLDDNGRLLLPKNLLEIAGIGEEATFASMVDSFEIWNPESYEANMDEIFADFEDEMDEIDPLGELKGHV